MQLRDILTNDIQHLSPDDTIDAARIHLIASSHSALPVIQADGTYLGEISEDDILRVAFARTESDLNGVSTDQIKFLLAKKSSPVSSILRSHSLTVLPTDSVHEVARTFLQTDNRILPVLENGKLIGVVTAITLLQHYDEVADLK